MNKDLITYWFPFIEKIHDYDETIDSENYIKFQDSTKKNILRILNGQPIKIISNIYNSQSYRDKIFIFFKRSYLRYIKEHNLFEKEKKYKYLESNNLSDFVTYICYNENYRELLKLYIYKLS